MTEQAPPSDTQAQKVLSQRLGEHWKIWQWLSRRFSRASAATILALIGTCGGYILHLNDKIATIKERVVVLETKVVPALADQATRDRLEQLESRVVRLEDGWFYAENVVKTSPTVRLRRKLRDE